MGEANVVSSTTAGVLAVDSTMLSGLRALPLSSKLFWNNAQDLRLRKSSIKREKVQREGLYYRPITNKKSYSAAGVDQDSTFFCNRNELNSA